MIGPVVLALAAIGLLATAVAQVRPLRRYRFALDALALVPEWRFYAQASLAGAADLARDTHIVVRDRLADGHVGGWTPVLWPAERRLGHALWNPRLRVDALTLSIAEDLAHKLAGAEVQQSVGYLVVLRRALAAPPATAGGAAVARQFAIVHVSGRGERALSLDFVSGWHCR